MPQQTLQASQTQNAQIFPSNNALLHLKLKISLCNEKAKLTHLDLGHIPKQDLPPKELASLGSKRILKQDILKNLKNTRKTTKENINNLAIPFDGGWLIPEDKLEEVIETLITSRDIFEEEKQYFLNEYNRNTNDFLNEFSQWQQLLINDIPSVADVEKKFLFEWKLQFILPKVGYSLTLQNSFSSSQAQSIQTQMITELSVLTQAIENILYVKNNAITWTDMLELRNFAEKLYYISFAKNEVFSLYMLVTEFIKLFKSTKQLNSYEVEIIKNFSVLFKDKALMQKILSEIDNGITRIDSLVQSLLPAQNNEDNIADFSAITNENVSTINESTNKNETEKETISDEHFDSFGLW